MAAIRVMLLVVGAVAMAPAASLDAQERQSARALGVVVGVLPPGPLNAVTDVQGVRVGQVTVVSGDSINSGVTAVLPHGGNVFREKVPAAVVVGNGYGKLVGFTQVQELGELESPIVLTCTLCVPRAADAVLTYLLELPGNEQVRSANAVVGETNDGILNHIRLRPITEEVVLRAIETAEAGPVEQGSVGAGRGTRAYGWKAGIGTASRRLPPQLGGWTVGVLVQMNVGSGVFTVAGAPVGKELGGYYLQNALEGAGSAADEPDDGSIMIVVATDAPLEHRNLERLGRRALSGLARTGATMTNGSGDYVIAFTTVTVTELRTAAVLPNSEVSPLFQAVAEATEEAIYNSFFLATTVVGHRGTFEALPLDATRDILLRYGVVR